MASDWLAAALPANQMPCCKIVLTNKDIDMEVSNKPKPQIYVQSQYNAGSLFQALITDTLELDGQWQKWRVFCGSKHDRYIMTSSNGNIREAGDLRRHRARYDVTVMILYHCNTDCTKHSHHTTHQFWVQAIICVLRLQYYIWLITLWRGPIV